MVRVLDRGCVRLILCLALPVIGGCTRMPSAAQAEPLSSRSGGESAGAAVAQPESDRAQPRHSPPGDLDRRRAHLEVIFQRLDITSVDGAVRSTPRDLVAYVAQDGTRPPVQSSCYQLELPLTAPPTMGQRIRLPGDMRASVDIVLERRALIAVGLRARSTEPFKSCGLPVATYIWDGERTLDCDLEGIRFTVAFTVHWGNIVAPSDDNIGCRQVVLSPS